MAKTYDAQEVSASFQAIPIDKGVADGEFISIEPASDQFQQYTGTDGETTISKTGNTYHEVKVRLASSSETNQVLSAILNVDLQAPNGAGYGPLIIADLQGLDLFTCTQARIKGWPIRKFDRGVTENEWTFMCPNPIINYGGN